MSALCHILPIVKWFCRHVSGRIKKKGLFYFGIINALVRHSLCIEFTALAGLGAKTSLGFAVTGTRNGQLFVMSKSKSHATGHWAEHKQMCFRSSLICSAYHWVTLPVTLVKCVFSSETSTTNRSIFSHEKINSFPVTHNYRLSM